MKPARWYRNVVARTLRAFLPGLALPDDGFAERLLAGSELELFRAMDRRDRHHAVAVAKAILRRAPDADAVLLRAALLHDVGKAVAPYRPWERIVVHLCAPSAAAEAAAARAITATGAAPEVEGSARWLPAAWERHRRHAARGAAMIRSAGGSSAVAALVERHHHPDGDPRLELLAGADRET